MFLKYPDRIMFGTDEGAQEAMYQNYFRWLETGDEYFLYAQYPAQKVAGLSGLEEAISALAERVPTVVVKMGAMGAMGAKAARGQEHFAVSSVKVEVVDTVGAGDSFDAGFLYQYLRDADLKTCLQYGNLAGAFSTNRMRRHRSVSERHCAARFLCL